MAESNDAPEQTDTGIPPVLADSESGEAADGSAHRSVGDAVGDGWSRVVRSEKTAGIVAGLEDRLARFRRERKLGKGTLRDTYLVGYRGYVAAGRAHVRVRVTEEPVVPQQAEMLTDPEVLRSNLRRFVALSFPGVRVQVSMLDGVDRMETDRHGYAAGTMLVGDPVPGWYDYSAATEPDDSSEDPTTARGQVLVPDPAAPVWVVSDIDDTVLQTGLAEGMAAVKNTLLGQARTRRAVPGMASLYRAIEGGTGTGARAPFFYLSTGPWALYDVLVEFLRVRGFPAGPLFLTDWGPQQRYITRSGTEHKRVNLRRLFTVYPEAKFLLVGDSGQHDPYNYVDLATEHPESVIAIIIIDVGIEEKAAAVREQEVVARAAGVPFYFVADAREAAVRLAELGIIDEAAVAAVAAAYERS